MLEEQRLDPAAHDCAGFDCGVAALNDYLVKFATQHRRRRISRTYVLVDPSTRSVMLGYYALSAVQIDVAHLSDADRKRLPRYPITCSEWAGSPVERTSKAKGLVDCCWRAPLNVA